ncbi:MAG: hypothetical protein Kow0063_31330 [Anaerolineae bacterium]
MEIEAKFCVPDEETYHRLRQANQVAGYLLSAGQVKQVQDTYLDTEERVILAAGYACRRREQTGGTLVTLKGLGGAQGAVHRRHEVEIQMPAYQPPAEWPASPARDQVLELIGEAPLIPLLTLQQTRLERLVSQDEASIAEMSLDSVRLVADDRELSFFEVEVELGDQGSEEDLVAMATCLQDEWGLEPEPRSKFERALDFLATTPARRKDRLLTPQERAALEPVSERDDSYGRRASALIALDEGATQATAAERAGMSTRQVRRWLSEFRKRRTEIFPPSILDQAHLIPAPTPLEPEPQGEAEESRPHGANLRSEPAPPRGDEGQMPQPEMPLARTLEKPPKSPGLEANDPMAEAARKTFWLHYRRMLYYEPGTRLGEDIEELHDMRVATRRMRAAFQVFGDYLDMDQMRPFLKGLRRTGRALGAVRDLDVFWEKTQHYLETLPPDQPYDLSPLRTAWEAERETARERMLAYLDSKRYARFVQEFGDFLQKPGAGALPGLSLDGEPLPHRLRHVVPVAVYQRLAAVWAYDEWVTGPDVPIERLHRLRIAAKGLRYTLEYFQEVLGPEAKLVINEVKAVQDHLGDLQDAVVASNLLRDFLTWGTWGHQQDQDRPAHSPTEPIVAPGVAAYLAARQTELQRLLDSFPQVWTHFQRPELSEWVTAALAPLFASNYAFTAENTQEGETMTKEPGYIVLLGPPASGKGTQAAQLREMLDLPHVASGDLFRENLKNETELGMKAKAYIDRGELVPDDVTIAMVMDRLRQPDCAQGALLDGFPRTMAQAEALDQALAARGHKISVVTYIAVPDEILVERVSGRRICRVCGESYHIQFNPPQKPGICDRDGGELYQRDDDKPETVRQRLKVYWEQTSPLIDYYRQQGVLVEINGDQPIEAVQADLRAAVSKALSAE